MISLRNTWISIPSFVVLKPTAVADVILSKGDIKLEKLASAVAGQCATADKLIRWFVITAGLADLSARPRR